MVSDADYQSGITRIAGESSPDLTELNRTPHITTNRHPQEVIGEGIDGVHRSGGIDAAVWTVYKRVLPAAAQ